MATRLHVYVSGDVQGVGFRDFVRAQATRRGLAGSAENLPDGRVEVIAEGERDACERLLDALRGDDGTPGSVREVEKSWGEPRGAVGFRAG